MSALLDSGLVGHGGTNEQIVKKWGDIGFLEGLGDGVLRLKMALIFEEVAKIQINKKTSDSRYDAVIFPIIRHIMCGIDSGKYSIYDKRTEIVEFITAEYILEETNRIYESSMATFELIFEGHKIDVEAEATAFIAEKIAVLFVKSFKNKNILDKFDIDGNRVVVNKPLLD